MLGSRRVGRKGDAHVVADGIVFVRPGRDEERRREGLLPQWRRRHRGPIRATSQGVIPHLDLLRRVVRAQHDGGHGAVALVFQNQGRQLRDHLATADQFGSGVAALSTPISERPMASWRPKT